MFLLNGVYIMADASWSLSDWQSVINPLLNTTTTLKSHHQPKHTTTTTTITTTHNPSFLSAPLRKAATLLPPTLRRYAAPNETCAANTTVCDYEPKKYECCLKGEYCIPNVGCTCVEEGGC